MTATETTWRTLRDTALAAMGPEPQTLDFSCPRCGAAVGVRCSSKLPGKSEHGHAPRVDRMIGETHRRNIAAMRQADREYDRLYPAPVVVRPTPTPEERAQRLFDRAVTSVGRRRDSAFTEAIDEFRSTAGLRRFHPYSYPVSVSFFGHARHWSGGSRYGNPPGAPYVPELDHHAFLSMPTKRLAVVMSWPYTDPETLPGVLAEAMPADRFVIGVDSVGTDVEDNADGRSRRTPAGIYASASTVPWIAADADTLGRDRAEDIVAAFLAGEWGLAESVAIQTALDDELALLYADRQAAQA